MSSQKQKVLLLGATGETGMSILEGLLQDTASFDVEALVRPQSVESDLVKTLLRDRNVPIRVVDIGSPVEELAKSLSGVDVLISAIDAMNQWAQLNLASAAKLAGVKRFVPCAFTIVSPAGGVMKIRDDKEEVYQHIKREYLPFTVIDVGYWHQISFPVVPSGRLDYAAARRPHTETIHAGGTAPNLLTDERDIGPFVARIIKDPRTLNQYVFTWSDELSENEIFAIVEELTGEKVERLYVSAEEILARRPKFKALFDVDPRNPTNRLGLFGADYDYSKYVRGDNSVAYAKYLGYLDARELYPDFTPISFRQSVQDVLDGKAREPYKGKDWTKY